MTATDLLARVAGAGIQLWSENGELRFRAPKGALTPELRAEIGARRAELIALLAEAAAVAAADDRDPLPSFQPELDDEIPLAPGQARWWFLDRLGADPRAALITAALDLRGPLDIARLARAFADIVRRHQPLRTAIVDHQGTPHAVLRPVPAPWPLPVTDAADDATADAMAREIAARPIDLADGLNLRTALIRQAPDHHRLVVVLHHAAADGWSLGVLLHEVQVLYDGGTLPPKKVTAGLRTPPQSAHAGTPNPATCSSLSSQSPSARWKSPSSLLPPPPSFWPSSARWPPVASPSMPTWRASQPAWS